MSKCPSCISSIFFFFKINSFIYFWLRWIFVVVRRLLIAVASRCGARALGTGASVAVARGLSSCGSRALEHRLSSCGTQA